MNRNPIEILPGYTLGIELPYWEHVLMRKEQNSKGGYVEYVLYGLRITLFLALIIGVVVVRSAAKDIDNDY